MSELDSFLTRCDALAEVSGLSLSTISSKLFNDGSRLKNVKGGKDVGTRRLAAAAADLAKLEEQYGITQSPQASSPPPSQACGPVPSVVEIAKPDTTGGTEPFVQGDRGSTELTIAGAK